MTNKVDKALQQAVAMYLGCTRLVKLWENASPTSLFAAQTVSMDLSGYDAVAVVFEVTNDQAYEFVECCRINHNGVASVIRNTASANISSGSIGAHLRKYEVVTSGIYFSGNVYSHANSYSTNNSGCIPLAVYGVKLSGGGSA